MDPDYADDYAAKLASVRKLLVELTRHRGKRPEDPAIYGQILNCLGRIEQSHGINRESRISRGRKSSTFRSRSLEPWKGRGSMEDL